MKLWLRFLTVVLGLLFGGTVLAASVQDDFVAACQRGDLASAQRLIKKGAAVNGSDDEGRTPLLAAVFSRKPEMVEWLLRNGADANAEGQCPEKNCSIHPALPLAVYLNEPLITKALLAAKADVTWHDHQPTRNANYENRVELLKMLRAAGGRESGVAAEQRSKPRGELARGTSASGVSELLAAGSASQAPPGEKLRVALIAEESLAAAVDLLTSALTGRQFQLVERSELNRVLAEQNLTAALGADRARMANLGALLGADALVLLRRVKLAETESLEMRFVRVSPGIVLDSAYRAWPLADATAWAGDAAARLAALDPKIRDTQGIAVATAPFRPLTDTPAAAQLAREALLLLNGQLARQPGVVLLEREAVDVLSREQALGKAGGFWAGSFVLDGTVEPPAREAGPATITLRVTPIGPGETKSFTAHGSRSELPRLLGELAAQAAGVLKLRAAPPSELQVEAQRHFDEARNLFVVGLPFAAHRAAATAAAFGLDSDEFVEWRFATALHAMATQIHRLVAASSFHELRWNGWAEAWIEKRTVGAEWLRPAEWCDLGVDAVRLWQRLLLAALRADDASSVAALLEPEKSALPGAFAVFHSLDLAATKLDYDDMHLAISRAARETLEEALVLADARPVHTANADALALQMARLAPLLYRDPASLAAVFPPLLARRFSKDSLENRLTVRLAVLGLDGTTTLPTVMAPESFSAGNRALVNGECLTLHGMAARDALRAKITPRLSAEDELTRATLDCCVPQSPAQRRALSDKLFELLLQRRKFFAEASNGVVFFNAICHQVSRWADTPKFYYRSARLSSADVEYTPEMFDLRRQLFILVARDSAHPSQASWLYDKNYHPPGEDAQEIARLQQRIKDDHLKRLALPPVPTAPAAPRPKLRGTPTYAKYPPLKVTRRWTTEATPHGRVEDLTITSPTFDPETKALWLFGSENLFDDGKTVHAYAFEISLPSLQTHTWSLQEYQKMDRSGHMRFVPMREFVYLVSDGEFLATGDRKTRSWKINREVQPVGNPVRAGDELFFLSRSGAAHGLFVLGFRDQAISILANSRRTVPQTPLDRPDLAPVDINVGASGLIEITTEPFDVSEPKTSARQKPQSVVTFDPVKRVWSEPRLLEKTSGDSSAFTPLTEPGIPRAYRKRPDTNLWTLQLPRGEMPKVRIPVEFAVPDAALENARRAQNEFGVVWYWVPQGYVIIKNGTFEGSTVYFLPQAELDAYLDAHVPDEDESSSSPPAPTK